MITYPIAKYVRLVYANPVLWAEFKSDADIFLARVIEAVQVHEKDYLSGPGANEGYYTFGQAADDIGINVPTLPLNQQNALGCTFAELYRVTGEQKYLQRVAELARFTKNRLFLLSNDSYAWMYWMDPRLKYNGPIGMTASNEQRLVNSVEDTSHAAITVEFMVQAYRLGVVFSAEDMLRLVNTLTKNVLTSDNDARMRIAGGAQISLEYALQVGRWGELGEFDPSIPGKLLNVYSGRNAPLLALALIVKWLP